MKTMIKMAVLTFLLKGSLPWQSDPFLKIKEICSVDLLSEIGNESISEDILRYIVPGGDFNLEYSLLNGNRIVQIWMPVQTIETPTHGFACYAS